MAEDKPDFIYIAKSIGLGLIPIKDGTACVNPNAITDITEDGADWIIHISGGRQQRMTLRDMLQLEGTLRVNELEAGEVMKQTYLKQLRAQSEAGREFAQGVAAVQGTLIEPAGGVPPRQWAGGKKNRR